RRFELSGERVPARSADRGVQRAGPRGARPSAPRVPPPDRPRLETPEGGERSYAVFAGRLTCLKVPLTGCSVRCVPSHEKDTPPRKPRFGALSCPAADPDGLRAWP